MVLVTDGCRNSGGSTRDAAQILQARGVPLYVLGVGDPSPPKDLEVVEVAAPRQVRRDTEVEAGRNRPPHRLRQTLRRRAQAGRHSAAYPHHHAQCRIGPSAGAPDVHARPRRHFHLPRGNSRSPEGEQIKENNVRDFLLEIKDDRLPVLYIEGSPRLEYRFLRRALFRDKNFRLVGVLRLAAQSLLYPGGQRQRSLSQAGFSRYARAAGGVPGDHPAATSKPAYLLPSRCSSWRTSSSAAAAGC